MYRPAGYLDDAPKGIQSNWEDDRKVLLFEDPGCDALSRSSIRELTDRTPERWELVVDRMEAEETPWQREGEEY